MLRALLFIFFISFSLLAENRPNIVVILCDDLGYGDLECFGHPNIKTPHLNKMADEGIRLTNFYSTAPVCSASRVGLLTGRSPNRAGVYDWIPPGEKAKPDLRHQVHMRKSETTIPALLKKAGYATALSGKWHCNSKFNSEDQPQPGDAGFDHWFATHNNASPSHANPKNFVRNGTPVGKVDGYSCQIVADEAVNWLTQHTKANKEQPFFLYVAFHEPHEPIASPKDLVEKYKNVASTEKEAAYFANVDNMDKAVGKLMSSLKSLGVDENTLVIFSSDNGPETLNRYSKASYSYGSAKPLKGMKLWTTEAGFRVSGIVRWPNGISSKSHLSDQTVSALDFMPTFCKLADVAPPSDLALDGTDMSPLFKGQKIDRPKPLVWAFYNALNGMQLAMRYGDWKVIAKLDHKKASNIYTGNEASLKAAKITDIEIYKITEDISESKNLAGAFPEKLQELKKKLLSEYKNLLDGSHVWSKK
ncbi:MAG: sulfatase-like hydrolase/transferase [Lentisphaeraceae bacterium]|nr:sulfatase-like hydrolase/transferase [Lentisphaeraceae bacterium]